MDLCSCVILCPHTRVIHWTRKSAHGWNSSIVLEFPCIRALPGHGSLLMCDASSSCESFTWSVDLCSCVIHNLCSRALHGVCISAPVWYIISVLELYIGLGSLCRCDTLFSYYFFTWGMDICSCVILRHCFRAVHGGQKPVEAQLTSYRSHS